MQQQQNFGRWEADGWVVTEVVDPRKWNPKLDWAKLRSKLLYTAELQKTWELVAVVGTAESGSITIWKNNNWLDKRWS